MPDTHTALDPVTIPGSDTPQNPLALGCWAFGGGQWGGQDDDASMQTMAAALHAGLDHFDTAAAYGGGHSETLVGQFLAQDDRLSKVYLATKGNGSDPQAIRKQLHSSLERLGVDAVDLYYLHWPKTGADLTGIVSELVSAREEGLIRGIGVSNFSVAQLKEVQQVTKIDAHQFGYNLIWRFAERDVLPYCHEQGIACVTYSSIAQGVLTGKFGPDPQFPEGDQRPNTTIFKDDVWPHVYKAVEQLKGLADEVGRPLTHLAIQWVARQPGVTSVLLGARTPEQARENAAAGQGLIDDAVLDRMTAICDALMPKIPDTGNIFQYNP
jgi:aryl-alcohol dehydrogenase-like predicted oxidoreductase